MIPFSNLSEKMLSAFSFNSYFLAFIFSACSTAAGLDRSIFKGAPRALEIEASILSYEGCRGFFGGDFDFVLFLLRDDLSLLVDFFPVSTVRFYLIGSFFAFSILKFYL